MKTLVLCILDGWGDAPDSPYNAITRAQTPFYADLKAKSIFKLLDASGLSVGLPQGQMGNSEVGHMTLGSGRVIFQDLPRIDRSIEEKSLEKNPALMTYISELKKNGTGVCHLMGLLSPGGVHSHENHIFELWRILKAHGVDVKFHAILDGRDTPPQSALASIARCPDQPVTISGRFYAMDRDNRWERTQMAFDNFLGRGATHIYNDAAAYVQNSYDNFQGDEFVVPAHLESFKGMQSGDGLLMANFRADRVRQILRSLLKPDFANFDRGSVPQFSSALAMTEYADDLTSLMPPMFPAGSITHTLGEILAEKELAQLRIAETEKYAHVTFFFNGGREEPYDLEDRVLVPSPNVATYDLMPQMSAQKVADAVVDGIHSQLYSFIVVNFANTDMVGHSGMFEPALKAVEAVDQCLGRIQKACDATNSMLIVTADHGNAECMTTADTQIPHTAHTTNLVPCLIYGTDFPAKVLEGIGGLADVAPTVLKLLNLDIPAEMTGKVFV